MAVFRRYLVYLVLALAILLVFGSVVKNVFLWDDEFFVQKNEFLKSWSLVPQLLSKNIDAGAGIISNIYRPLQSFTHFVDLQLYGYEAWGHHLTNLFFFIGAAFGLLTILVPLFGERAALAAYLFFFLHPLQANPVAYISGRGDVMGIFFLSWGIFFFYRNLAFSIVCAILALASKESFALFPVFLFLYDQLRSSPAKWWRFTPFALLSAAYIGLRLTLLNFQNTLNFANQDNVLSLNPLYRVFTFLSTLPKAFLLWIWPSDVHHERFWPVYGSFSVAPVYIGAIVLGLALLLICFFWKPSKPVSIGLAWFFLATLPTSNLLVLINALFYDHWFVLPGLGFVFPLAYIFQKVSDKQLTQQIALGVWVIYCGVLLSFTFEQNKVWKNPESLFLQILKWEPDSVKSMNNLAMTYSDNQRFDEAIDLYRKAIDRRDIYPNTHHNLGIALLRQNKIAEALDEMNKAINMDSNFFYSYLWIGKIEIFRGNREAAKIALQKALAINPSLVEASELLKNL